VDINGNDKARNKILLGMTIVFFIIWVIFAINPYERSDWLIENILIFAALIYLIATFNVFRFSLKSYFFIFIFLILHVYGAHYCYTKTPVDKIIHQFIDFKRNNYDRVVHFSFGLLMVYPIKEMIERVVKVKKIWANTFSILTIMAFASFYELLEMWVATIFAPELGPLFLGTQGDVWDTHHDIEQALYGSILTIGISIIFNLKLYFQHD